MSTNSTTVEPDVKPEGGLGNRKDGNLKAAFPGTPTYGEYNPTAVRNAGISAFNGNGGDGDAITGNTDGEVNDPGYMFGTYNLNFPDSPNIAGNTATANGTPFGEGGGAPVSPYIPPSTSPGQGSVSATDQPANGSSFTQNNSFGSGDNLANPSITSRGSAGDAAEGGIASQKMKELTLGESGA